VDNIVSDYIYNNLPIYLLYLPDMRLVHRSAVKELINLGINEMVEAYQGMECGAIQQEANIKKMVKDRTAYAIFSHRWLPEGELTFQDLSKLQSISATGFSRMIESSKEELKVLCGARILDRAMVSSKGDVERNGGNIFEQMKGICGSVSAEDHHAGGVFRASVSGETHRIRVYGSVSGEDHHAGGFVKFVKFCEAALQLHCDYVWLDTGCINKQSSAELEESIRSMFRWYRNSEICIVHLSTTTSPGYMSEDPWFSRGWTLQEILAPKAIKFFWKSWQPVTAHPNDKIRDADLGIPLWKLISQITQIPEDQLLNFTPGTKDIRERMVWASKRKTTRIEDMAYCLIGIFDIPLSIAYGEGRMAFYRLQVEIMQRSHDRGLFAWSGSSPSHNSMFAAGPEAFLPLEGKFLTAMAPSSNATYTLTNYGLRIALSVYEVQCIKELSEKGLWVKYELTVPELEKVYVALPSQTKYENLAIGILGNRRGLKSLAILLNSPEINSKQYTRIATQYAIELLGSSEWKQPAEIFIE
jgi:hypothetical protein